MSFFESIGQTINNSFSELWMAFVAWIPDLIAAIIILVIGLIVAGALGKLVQRLVEITKVDDLINRIDMIQRLNTAGGKVTLSGVLGWLVKWFLILVTLIAVADILSLDSFNVFLNQVALYFPNVVIAVLILMAGIVFGNGTANVIRRVLKGSSLRVGQIVATVAQWAIVVFAVLAALVQLKIAPTLITTLFTGVVVMLALAGGLAFGLGGKDAAKGLIDSLRDEMKH